MSPPSPQPQARSWLGGALAQGVEVGLRPLRGPRPSHRKPIGFADPERPFSRALQVLRDVRPAWTQAARRAGRRPAHLLEAARHARGRPEIRPAARGHGQDVEVRRAAFEHVAREVTSMRGSKRPGAVPRPRGWTMTFRGGSPERSDDHHRRWCAATATTTCAGGTSPRARVSVAPSRESPPHSEQNCFGTGRPYSSRVRAWSRVPSPPARTIAHPCSGRVLTMIRLPARRAMRER